MIRLTRPWIAPAPICTGPRTPFHDWDTPFTGQVRQYIRCVHCPVKAFWVGEDYFQELSVTLIEWP